MLIVRSHQRLLGIALMAITGLLSLVGETSACAMMPRVDSACAASCQCCETPAAPEVAQPKVVAGQVLRPSARIIEVVETSGCVCCVSTPNAPEPRGPRSLENRTELGRVVAAVADVDEARPTLATRPIASAFPGPRRCAIYLRNARLLI